MEALRKLGQAILDMITFSYTGIDAVDWFVYFSSTALLFVFAAAVVTLLIKSPGLRKRERTEDRFMFAECVLVLILLGLDIFMAFNAFLPYEVMIFTMGFLPVVADLFFMLIILQWMVFVDYSLYRSRDHIRQKYRLALVPVLVVMGIDLAQFFMTTFITEITDAHIILNDIAQIAQVAVELGYVLTAVHLVYAYEKESREPRFLRLSAFIIPFILGNLIRSYDASLMALGILLTYRAVQRRDRYLDRDTQFYNRAFLEYTGKFRDRKRYTGGNGILINAPGRGKDMASILRELKPVDSNVFVLEKDRYLLLSEALRGSAVKLAVDTITEAAEGADPPYTPKICAEKRDREESAAAFALRLLSCGGNKAALKGVAS